jgi:tRNA A-37 threonylcarbamoyl transferase component Bud32
MSIDIEEYLSEYEIYKIMNIENKNYNIENLSDYFKFENVTICSDIILKFEENDIIIPINYFIRKSENQIYNIYILAGNYNPEYKTLSYYLHTNDLHFLTTLINKALINRRNAVDTQNFKHGDFKTNNILVKEEFNIYLFDLDFSVIVNNNDKIKLKDCEKINFYLDLNDENEITGLFLDFFDIYILSLSMLYGYINKKRRLRGKMNPLTLSQLYHILITG